ncbi:tripartite motif-containing protein 2-like isoform X2 [Sycon ciliatum]|uniref:tripartite motif-containing protein 2-like isoform X2 n=1 Tax=Sycon ciliatum TaxID=27933 RepID=UPI0031F67827
MDAEENAVFTALGLNQAEVPYLGTLDVNETEDELGRGSFAVVYKSKWCGLKVAAKALHSILIDRRNQGRDVVLHDFGAEIARMARLRHPHLCPIFGVSMVGTTPAIVVELMSDTLETMSVGARRQDLLQLMRYIEHTAAGLRYLHSIPMVHRDLKPSNVLVANGVAKITDFGVSKLLPSVADLFREAAQSMTRQPGTPLFMPPEALQETESGRARYDLSLDVFSFGVTAMSVLSGVMPSIELMFAARSRQAADGSHVAIPELERRRADFARIPDGHPLKDLLRRCLADPPARRPDAEEIHEFVQGVAQSLSSLPQQTASPLEESMGDSAGLVATILDTVRSVSTAVRDLSTSQQQLGTRLDNLSAQVEVTNNRMTQVQQEVSAEARTTNDKMDEIQLEARTSYEQVAQLSDTMARGEQDTTAACERIVEMQNQTNTTVRHLQEQSATSSTSIGQLLEQSATSTTSIGQLLEQSATSTTNISQLQQHQQDTSDKLSRVSAAVTTIQQGEQDTTAACERIVEMQNQTNTTVRQLQEQSATTSTSIGQLLEQQQDTSDKVSRVSAAVTTIQQGEQDTTAACERIVEMQNQTNTTVRQLHEQSATSSTSIGQLLEHQQDTSDKLSRVSAAVTTIQQAQSDMRSDLEGKISEVKSSVTAVEGIVRKVATQNHYRSIRDTSTSFGSKGNGRVQFSSPQGITISNDGKVFIADHHNHRVKVTTLDGTYIRDIGKPGSGNAEFNYPTDVAVDGDGDLVVVDNINKRLQVLHQDGSYVKTIGNGAIGSSYGVAALSLPQHGICYAVTDYNVGCVRVFEKGGRLLNKFGTKGSGPGQFNGPIGIISSNGRLLVVDKDNHRIQVFTTDGNFITMFGSKGESDGQFKSPRHIAEDRHGHLLVTDDINHRVEVFTSDTFSHVATFGSRSCLPHPQGIAVSPSGTVYVSNWVKHCITMF